MSKRINVCPESVNALLQTYEKETGCQPFRRVPAEAAITGDILFVFEICLCNCGLAIVGDRLVSFSQEQNGMDQAKALKALEPWTTIEGCY